MAADSGARFTVLVTRPADRADELIAALGAAGFGVRHVPLLTVAPLDPVADADRCRRAAELAPALDRYSRVLAVSVNAVHYGLDWLARFWPQWPLGLRWYGIGAATAAAFAERAIHAVEPGGAMDTETLLALPEFTDLSGERVLILRGVGGRGAMAQTLRARGAGVDYLECYRRLPPVLDAAQRDALWQPPADAVCLNSGETLQQFWRQLPAAARALYRGRAVVVPSARVAGQAVALGLTRVVVAANAGTAATLDALQRLNKDQQQ
jgi:uroporphyrinogen-III synthase